MWFLFYIHKYAHVNTHTFQVSEKINSKCYIRKLFWLTSQFCWLLPIFPFLPTFPILSSLRSESWDTDPCELHFFSSLSASLGLGIGWTAGGEKWGCPLLCSPRWPHCSGHDYPSKNVAAGVWSPTLLLPPIKPGEPDFFPHVAHIWVFQNPWGPPLGVPLLCAKSLHCVRCWPLDELVFPTGALTHKWGSKLPLLSWDLWLGKSKEQGRTLIFYSRSPNGMICETLRSPDFPEGSLHHLFFFAVAQETWLGFTVQFYSCSWLHINL